MRIDIMTDIETLGTHSDSQIIQIAACAFNIETGEIISQFNECVDICNGEHIKVTGNTLSWWLKTNSELLSEIIKVGNETSKSLKQVLTDFDNFIYQWDLVENNEIYLWGNGILFDNKMIQAQMESVGLKYPIFYRNDRDMRTIVDLACKKMGISEKELREGFNDDSLVAHNAFDDVKYQINIVTKCYRILTE